MFGLQKLVPPALFYGCNGCSEGVATNQLFIFVHESKACAQCGAVLLLAGS